MDEKLPLSNQELKKELRAKIKILKNNFDPKIKKQAEDNIFNFIKNWNVFKSSKNIAIYHSLDHELETRLIIQEILKLHKNCYLPVIDTQYNHFDFYSYTESSILIPNKFKILEPNPNIEIKTDIQNLDIIFMPLMAFTNKKDRLGMGGGYYDKTLKNISNKKNINNKKPILIGLGFELQKVEFIPLEPWDIRLDIIVSEDNIY